MPGSILINDGRRSASPDRRVTFGNIERYDIMTSNEMKDIKSRRGEDVNTINGNYPMTRLDNRIRKAVMLGFTETQGDTVTYEEIVNFLLEFRVIVHAKLCNERQITAIIQSSFPRCVVKPSVKHNILFHNIENRSDEVIKEELVRVTTEPIINSFNSTASMEASEWIKEENESDQSDDDNEELSQIENIKRLKEESENVDVSEKEEAEEHSSAVKITSNTPTYSIVKPNFDERLTKDNHDQNTSDSQEVLKSDVRDYNHRFLSSEPKTKQISNELSATIRDLIAATNLQTQEILKQKEQSEDQSQDHSPVAIRERINSPPPESVEVPRRYSLTKERAIDVPDHILGGTNLSQANENQFVSKDDSQTSIKRTGSFSNSNLGRSKSVQDMAKKFEQATDSKSSLQRKRSFTRSTDRSFVGSIRDRFRSKPKDGDKAVKTDQKEGSKKKLKKDEQTATKVKSTANIKISTPKADRRIETTAPSATKTINDTRNTSRTSSIRKNEFGGSTPDVRNSFRSKHEVKSTYRINTNLPASKTNVTARSTGQLNKEENVSPFQRSGTSRNSQTSDVQTSIRKGESNNDVRSSIRRTSHDNTNNIGDVRSSVRKSKTDVNKDESQFQRGDVRSSARRDTVDKNNNAFQYGRVSSTRASLRTSSSATATPKGFNSTVRSTTTTNPRSSFRDSNTSSPVKRSNSRLSSKTSSKNSSNTSTPTLSRENSKTNFKPTVPKKKTIPVKHISTQEKDLARIARAFQQATDVIEQARDNIEQFMIQIATEDIEEAMNNRLKIEDLYDHIRHRMIIAKDLIFDGRQNDVTVDMSQYFDLLFRSLASNFDRVGCEVITNKISGEKVCYLIHLKLVDYVDDLQVLSEASVIDMDDDDVEATYV